MTTVLIDDKSLTGSELLEYVKHQPQVAHVVYEGDNTPLPMLEEDLVSLDEFKVYMEDLAIKRLGLKLTL